MPNSYVHAIYKMYFETPKKEREAMEVQNQLEEVLGG